MLCILEKLLHFDLFLKINETSGGQTPQLLKGSTDQVSY